MKCVKLALIFSLLTALSALFGGCLSRTRDNSIPWSRPATWENEVPGMGGAMPSGGY